MILIEIRITEENLNSDCQTGIYNIYYDENLPFKNLLSLLVRRIFS